MSPGLPLRTLTAGHPGPRSLGYPLRFGGSLGVSPGLPLRTLAAGHPGPRSLGYPLRFGPPGVARSYTPEGQPRAHPSLTVLGPACSPLGGDLRPGKAGLGGVGRASGTGLRVPEAPRLRRGRFAARRPVPFPEVWRPAAGGSGLEKSASSGGASTADGAGAGLPRLTCLPCFEASWGDCAGCEGG